MGLRSLVFNLFLPNPSSHLGKLSVVRCISPMSRSKQTSKTEFAKKTREFLNIAYKDYLASRVLINAHLPVQGAVLASTAIEKYFKAILSFRGNESRGHLKKAHFNAVKNFDTNLWGHFNKEFFMLLQKIYSLRYHDNLEKGFNAVIASREFLAELDFTAINIQESFWIKLAGEKVILMYHQDKKQQDPRLFHNNHVLEGFEKQSFISEEPQLVYEVRNCNLRGFLEISYLAKPQTSDGKFMRPGCTPNGSDGMQYKTALLPLQK